MFIRFIVLSESLTFKDAGKITVAELFSSGFALNIVTFGNATILTVVVLITVCIGVRIVLFLNAVLFITGCMALEIVTFGETRAIKVVLFSISGTEVNASVSVRRTVEVSRAVGTTVSFFSFNVAGPWFDEGFGKSDSELMSVTVVLGKIVDVFLFCCVEFSVAVARLVVDNIVNNTNTAKSPEMKI